MAVSNYKNKLISKGGLVLLSYNNFEGRPIMDIDFLAKRLSNNESEMSKVINEIIEKDTANKYVEFEVKSIENIAEHKAYHGVRLKIIAKISNTRTSFDIDIGIGDVIVPDVMDLELPTQLDGFESPKLKILFSRINYF